jgi:AraC-like DNA-binding protein/ligand-binding sensor protein
MDNTSLSVSDLSLRTRQLNEVLHHLYRALDIRIALFNAEGHELDLFDIKPMSPFCRDGRRRKAFRERCIECDRRHLREAIHSGRPLSYRCHAGLLEGVIPLSSGEGLVLGAIIFGQLRPAGTDVPADLPASLRNKYARLPTYSEGRVRHITTMIEYISHYIVRNELLRRQPPRWVQRVGHYIDESVTKNIQLSDLARAAGRSVSFLSHRFRDHFGLPPMRYIRKRRMEMARLRLLGGAAVRDVALELSFYDEFHFSKAFKAWFGHSPSELKP